MQSLKTIIENVKTSRGDRIVGSKGLDIFDEFWKINKLKGGMEESRARATIFDLDRVLSGKIEEVSAIASKEKKPEIYYNLKKGYSIYFYPRMPDYAFVRVKGKETRVDVRDNGSKEILELIGEA